MDEFRVWWANAVRSFLAWLANAWDRFTFGITHGWEVSQFILVAGAILAVGLAMLWRRKA